MICPDKIDANSQGKWLDQNSKFLRIPPVCSSHDGICAIIKVSYEVRFNFGAGGMSTSRDVSIPIKIGTIPIRNENIPNIPQDLIQDERTPLMPIPVPMPEKTIHSSADLPPSYDSLSFAPSQFENSPIDAPYSQYKGEMYNSSDASFRPNYIYIPNPTNQDRITQ